MESAGDRLRSILDEWKTINGLDRKTDDALWKRYSAERETFNRRRGSHFAELDRDRAGAREAKEKLCVKAEDSSTPPTGARPAPNSASCWSTGRPPDALPAMSTTPCGTGSKPPRTPSSRPASRDRRAGCRIRRERHRQGGAAVEAEKSTPAIPKQPGRRCGRSATSGTRSARFPGSGRLTSSADCVRSRRRCATPPSLPADPQAQARAEQFRERAEQFERQAQKAEAAGRSKEADEAKANAEQWRQWAEAAAER